MHLASFHSYFYEHADAVNYAFAMAGHERKVHRVERRAGNKLFRFEVIATDIDIITRQQLPLAS